MNKSLSRQILLSNQLWNDASDMDGGNEWFAVNGAWIEHVCFLCFLIWDHVLKEWVTTGFIILNGGEDRVEKISPGQEEGEHDWFSISVQSAKELWSVNERACMLHDH